jgi:hypothetical protein
MALLIGGTAPLRDAQIGLTETAGSGTGAA